MKYMLLIYINENALSETEREYCYEESAKVAQELHTKRQFVATDPLILLQPQLVSVCARANPL